MSQEELWRAFIGPHADRYLDQFKKFSLTGMPRYRLSWNWAPFLFSPFLWFLYRKMYLYAFVYAVGPVASFLITQDAGVVVVWSVVAALSADYLYYWHVRSAISELTKRWWLSREHQEQAVREAGGVQPYVIWVGVGLFLLSIGALYRVTQNGLPGKGLRLQDRPTPSRAYQAVSVTACRHAAWMMDPRSVPGSWATGTRAFLCWTR
jgi:hypothetical protein